jgi:Zn-dependent peptidase ImmA (M78 family)
VEFRRNFRTEGHEIARQVRRDLGLELHEPVDPWVLAKSLDIPVTKLSGLGIAEADFFLAVDTAAFSAVTVFERRKRMIVYNDAHDPGRQANDVSHELGHGLLLHIPRPGLSFFGCRNWDPMEEAEATWLGAAILISDEAAIYIVQSGMTVMEAATRYGVSRQLVQMRINLTGARNRVARMGTNNGPGTRAKAAGPAPGRGSASSS